MEGTFLLVENEKHLGGREKALWKVLRSLFMEFLIQVSGMCKLKMI